jgi:hypothetical protein
VQQSDIVSIARQDTAAELPPRAIRGWVRITDANGVAKTYSLKPLRGPDTVPGAVSAVAAFRLIEVRQGTGPYPNIGYTVQMSAEGCVTCNCLGFKHGGRCKHIDGLVAMGIIDREHFLAARKVYLEFTGQLEDYSRLKIELGDALRKAKALEERVRDLAGKLVESGPPRPEPVPSDNPYHATPAPQPGEQWSYIPRPNVGLPCTVVGLRGKKVKVRIDGRNRDTWVKADKLAPF